MADFRCIKTVLFVAGLVLTTELCDPAWAQDRVDNSGNSATTSTTTSGIGANKPSAQRPSVYGGNIAEIPEKKDPNTHLPPILAVRGLSDSPQIKKVLHSMVTSQVPVMYQTMMMVENGAATGFVGSMKTVSKLLNNATNSAQLEIKLKQITDPKGGEAYAYARSIHKGMTEQRLDQGQKLWPVGIFYASGDKVDDKALEAGETIKEKPEEHEDGGSIVADAFKPLNGATSGSGPSGAGAASSGPGTSSEETLSKILWGENDESMNQSFGTNKQFQEYIIGDLKIGKGSAKQGEPNSISNVSFVDPKHKVEDKNPREGSTTTQYLKGFYYWKHKLKQNLWTNTYKLMGEYCNFKANNENSGKDIFQKLTPASRITPEMIRNTSSPSFKWTVSLLDIFFKTWVETRSIDRNVPTKIDCDFEGNEAPNISMPEEFKTPDNKFDNCRESPKECARNRWILRLVDLIAEDRVISEFKNWHEAAINRALGHHPWVAVRVEELMCTSLHAGRNPTINPATLNTPVVLCDSTMWLDRIAESNRQKWVEIMTDLTKMAQNAGGSASFTVQQNSIHNGQGGGVQGG